MKHIILLAGASGAGKSYLSNLIKEQHKGAKVIAQDTFKEVLFESVGFNDLDEKEVLIEKSREMFYEMVDTSVKLNDIVILDYPFSYKQLNFFDSLKKKYDVKFLTLRLQADYGLIYDRRIKRDVLPDRNKGHVLHKYNGYETYTSDTYPLSREEYVSGCEKSDYNNFKYEKTIPIDVSDYSKVNYDSVLEEVNKFIN